MPKNGRIKFSEALYIGLRFKAAKRLTRGFVVVKLGH